MPLPIEQGGWVSYRTALCVLEKRESFAPARVCTTDHSVHSVISVYTTLSWLLLLVGYRRCSCTAPLPGALTPPTCGFVIIIASWAVPWFSYKFSARHSGCLGLNTGQSLWNLWWAGWHWDRFFLRVFWSCIPFLLVWFHQSLLIYSPTSIAI